MQVTLRPPLRDRVEGLFGSIKCPVVECGGRYALWKDERNIPPHILFYAAQNGRFIPCPASGHQFR